MQELVLDMLTYSKEREPEYELSDINEIIESVCDLVGTKVSKNGVHITCTLDPLLGEIMLDPKGLRRCLLNLVSNAVDACKDEEEGSVEITTETNDDTTFLIKVSDNGCGIKEQERKKMFQIFFSTKGSKGTGLGLAVTQKIISEHSGTIAVESEVGRGTIFTIELPLRKEAASYAGMPDQK